MKKEEAIEMLCAYGVPQDEKRFQEAIDMAREYQDKEENGELVSVVRCKDCKHWHSNTEFCGIWSFQNIAQRTLSDDYCSRAERKEE